MPNGEKTIAYNENVHEADSFYSKIIVNKIENNRFFESDVTVEKTHANYPVLCSLDAQHIIVAWTDNSTIYYRVMNTNDINKPGEYPVNKSGDNDIEKSN